MLVMERILIRRPRSDSPDEASQVTPSPKRPNNDGGSVNKRLASLCVILPVTTATVERSFSDMKFVKTRLRSRLSEETLDQAMRVRIEGPEKLSYRELETIVEHWKNQKKRRLAI